MLAVDKPTDRPQPEPVPFPDDPFGPAPAPPVTSYTELIEAIRAQIGVLGVRYQDFDTLTGFTDGYSGKVFGPSQVKRCSSESLFYALRAAGLRLRVEVDPEQMAKMQAIIKNKLMHPRQANQARPGNEASPAGTRMMSRVFRHFAKLGGKARMSQMSPKEMRKHQQNAALARAKKDRKRRDYLAKERARGERRRAAAKALPLNPEERSAKASPAQRCDSAPPGRPSPNA